MVVNRHWFAGSLVFWGRLAVWSGIWTLVRGPTHNVSPSGEAKGTLPHLWYLHKPTVQKPADEKPWRVSKPVLAPTTNSHELYTTTINYQHNCLLSSGTTLVLSGLLRDCSPLGPHIRGWHTKAHRHRTTMSNQPRHTTQSTS
jgi:hypothetical protein